MARGFVDQHVVRVRCDPAAFARLDLPTDATVEQVDSTWRKLRSEHHPDRGGDPATFDALKKAYDAARFWALEPKPCAACGGEGRVFDGGNFSHVRCEACNGRGTK